MAVCTEQTPGSCGATCGVVCPAPPQNASAVCKPVGPGGHDGVCVFECQAGLLRCGDACCSPALVAAGGEFTCASSTAGEVHCFGAGDSGELATGALADRAYSSALAPALAITGVTALVAGGAHACALTSTGTHCWGARAAFGASGSGRVALEPELVPTLAGATALAAGTSHTCAVVPSGVRCVGAAPAAGGGSPSLGGTVLAVAAGDAFSCALVDGGGGRLVKCWGDDTYGQLGDGGGAAAGTVVTVAVPGTVQHLAAGARHACAGDPTGAVKDAALWCWGDNTTLQLGPLGPGIFAPTLSAKVKKPVLAISGGGHATCAVEADAGAHLLSCWSSDPLVAGGAIVNGEPNPVASALAGPGLPPAVSAGAAHTCFVDAAAAPAKLKCFGAGGRGRLGDGAGATSTSPVLVLDR